uniref:F-box domain-containing protein n=1 Tax=Psilocybe cubensis TaxID=181762 RepID=A0A8H8CGY8_PSICU
MNYLRSEKTSLLCLSPELVTAIAEEMQVADIKQLRLTCSTIADYLVPLVFRTIKLTVYGNKCQWGVERIEALASGTHPACHASRALIIGPLCPGKPLDRSYLFTFGYKTQTISNHASESNVNEPLEIAIAREKVASHLFNAITSCRGVRAVKWTPNAGDEQIMHQITMNSLKNLPSLRRLHIRFQDFDVPLEIDSLRSLTELIISIKKCSSERLNTILDNVAKAVGQNPALVSIELDVREQESRDQEVVPLQHFKRFLKYYSTANEPMRLRHLKLTSFNLLLDQISISHLRHLTSLNLRNIKCKNGVWEPFIEAGICLTEISVDWASQSFCNYLASYTGLKKLSLMAYNFSTVEDSDTMAILFYEIGLDNHAQSLEDVKIVPMSEGLWCFGSHNYKSIAQLTNLRHLEMNVLSYDVRNNGETQANGTQKITENNAVFFVWQASKQFVWIILLHREGQDACVELEYSDNIGLFSSSL